MPSQQYRRSATTLIHVSLLFTLFECVLPFSLHVPEWASRRKISSSSSYSSLALSAARKNLSPAEIDQAILPLMRISSAHFISQALHAFVRLGIPDILGNEEMTVEEIAGQIGPRTNQDALLRILRLLESSGIILGTLTPSNTILFRLSCTGALLQTKVDGQPSLASGVKHWMEEPLWDAWKHLPAYIEGRGDGSTIDPFQLANGESSDFYYSSSRPQSLQNANEFVRFISDVEIESVVNGLDWSKFSGKIILDIGGYNGSLMAVVADKHPNASYKCLDLPHVIASIGEENSPDNVELISGDIFDPSTVPKCDVIFMKHFLDRCMWDEEETISILQTCHSRLPEDGIVVIGETVVPDPGQAEEDNQMQVSLDALYMLVGRERQRTKSEWMQMCGLAGFRFEDVIATNSPTCSLIILRKTPLR